MVWPHFKVLWFSKDNPTEHSERKKNKRQTEEDNMKELMRMDFASSTRAAENRIRWKGIIANSSLVPRQPSKIILLPI